MTVRRRSFSRGATAPRPTPPSPRSFTPSLSWPRHQPGCPLPSSRSHRSPEKRSATKPTGEGRPARASTLNTSESASLLLSSSLDVTPHVLSRPQKASGAGRSEGRGDGRATTRLRRRLTPPRHPSSRSTLTGCPTPSFPRSCPPRPRRHAPCSLPTSTERSGEGEDEETDERRRASLGTRHLRVAVPPFQARKPPGRPPSLAPAMVEPRRRAGCPFPSLDALLRPLLPSSSGRPLPLPSTATCLRYVTLQRAIIFLSPAGSISAGRVCPSTCADEGQQPPQHVRASRYLASAPWCPSVRDHLRPARLRVRQEDRPLELHCYPAPQGESVGAGELPRSIKGEVDVTGR